MMVHLPFFFSLEGLLSFSCLLACLGCLAGWLLGAPLAGWLVGWLAARWPVDFFAHGPAHGSRERGLRESQNRVFFRKAVPPFQNFLAYASTRRPAAEKDLGYEGFSLT